MYERFWAFILTFLWHVPFPTWKLSVSLTHQHSVCWKSRVYFTYLEDGGSASALPYNWWVPKFENQHLQSPLQTQAANIYNYKSLKAKPTISFTYFISQFFSRNNSEGMHFFCLFSMNQGKKKSDLFARFMCFSSFFESKFSFWLIPYKISVLIPSITSTHGALGWYSRLPDTVLKVWLKDMTHFFSYFLFLLLPKSYIIFFFFLCVLKRVTCQVGVSATSNGPDLNKEM